MKIEIVFIFFFSIIIVFIPCYCFHKFFKKYLFEKNIEKNDEQLYKKLINIKPFNES